MTPSGLYMIFASNSGLAPEWIDFQKSFYSTRSFLRLIKLDLQQAINHRRDVDWVIEYASSAAVGDKASPANCKILEEMIAE